MVAPVDVVRADVDDEAGIQLRDRARFRVVAPAAERVAGYRLPRSPILPVPHPLLRQHAVHPRRPERLTACTQSSAPSRHTDAECTFRIAFILWFLLWTLQLVGCARRVRGEGCCIRISEIFVVFV